MLYGRTVVGYSSRSRNRRLAAIAASVAVIAVAVAMVALRRNAFQPHTLGEAIMVQHQRWAGTPRGPVFIETPIDLTGSADLGPAVAHLTRLYEASAEDVAALIPADTVKLIERVVSTLPGTEGPRERLARADAEIGVMTIVNLERDSIRVFVAMQRVVDPPERLPSSQAMPPARRPARSGAKILESWPIVIAMAPASQPSAAVNRAASALTRALQIDALL